jgi:hypothetical protein
MLIRRWIRLLTRRDRPRVSTVLYVGRECWIDVR